MIEPSQSAIQIEPTSPRFAATLEAAGAKRWVDASFPYDLAGKGTASGEAMRAFSALSSESPEWPEDPRASSAGPEGAPDRDETAGIFGSLSTGLVPTTFVLDPPGVGAIGVVVRPGYVRGEIVPVAIFRDLVLPRDVTLARTLFAQAVAYARKQGASVAVSVATGTAPPLADLASGWDDVPAFTPVAKLRTLRVVPLLWRFEDTMYKVHAATKAEIPALAYLLNQHRRDFAFAPPVDEPSFVAGINRCPNFKIGDFRLAREKGEMVASCASWEPGPALPLALDDPSAAESLLGSIARTLGRFSPFPRLPGNRGALRVRFVHSFASKKDHPLVLQYLLDRIANETRKAGAHAFEVTLGADDSHWPCVRGRLRRVRMHSVWAASLDGALDVADLGPADPSLLDPGH